MPADVADVQRDGVGEQHQHEAERRHDAKDWRVESGGEEVQPVWTDQQAQREEDRDLRKAGPLDQSRQQRGNDDDRAGQREHRDEEIG